MWKYQLRAILWKNLLIRRRHYLLTILEASIPILLFLMAAYGRSKITSISKSTIEDVTYNDKLEIQYEKAGFDQGETLIFYSPSNEYFDDLIHRVQVDFQFISNNIYGFKNEKQLLEKFAKTSNYSVIPIIFNSAAGSSNLDYTIKKPQKRLSEDSSWSTSKLYSESMLYQPGIGSAYLYNGLLSLQKSIDMSFIEKEKEKQRTKLPETVIFSQEFPYPPHKRDNGMSDFFMHFLPLITLFSFLFVIPLVLKRIVEEKYTGIKELMKMVGISTWMIWLGWFIHSVIPMLISVIVIVLLLKVDFFGAGYPAIEYTDATILFTFLLLYIVANTIVCFFISTWTHRPFLSTLLGQLFLIVLSYILPKFLIGKKAEAPFSTSILLMLFPNMGLHYGFLAIQQYEIREIGVKWSNFYIPGGQGSNDISMLHVFIMQIVDCVVYMLLALYVDSVNPGKYGMPKSIFFPFKGLYNFFKGRNDVDVEKGSETYHLQDVEKAQLSKGIELIDLCKRYGKKTAVRKLKMPIYKDQITVLLGHNGAGKSTTMGMITGMIKRTSGKIIINGREVQSRSDITESLGLCPQESLFFPTLTVSEHLMFFAMLKGKRWQESTQEIDELLETLHLSDKKNSLAHKLSGGMKRKLCLGIAVVGGSKILILDEPSSGMDPQSRREMWDLLHKWRNEKTILITTHFMEEADALGDWIAIMNEGELKCYGTPMYLKKKYETGSNLILLVKKDADVTEVAEKLEKIIKTDFNFKTAKCKGINGNEVRFLLPDGNYIKMFEFLESNKDEYDIENISFTCTTLEDVFLSPKVTYHDEDDEDVKGDLASIARSKESEFYLTLKALLFKRYRFIFRKSMFYIIPTAVAILFIVLCVYMGSQKQDYSGASGPPLKFALTTYGKTTVYMNATGDSKIGRIYEQLVSNQNSRLNTVNDVSESIVKAGIDNLPYYQKSMIAAAEIAETESKIEAVAMYNSFALHSAPISVNLITNTIAKYTLGDQYSISTQSHPLAMQSNDTDENVDIIEIIILWLAVMPWGFLFFVGSFIYFPYVELSTKFTQLQFMCGVTPAVYWLTTFVADLIIYLIFAVIMCLIYTLFWVPFRGIYEFGALYLVLALYGMCAIPNSYLYGRLKTFASAYSHFITIGSFTGALLTIGVQGLRELPEESFKTAGNILNVILLITCPQYGLIYWGLKYSLKVIENYNFEHTDDLHRLVICSSDKRNSCCDGPGPACDMWKSYMNLFNPEIWYMLICAVIYLLLNMLLDSYFRKKATNFARNFFTGHYTKLISYVDTPEELADKNTLRVKKLKKSYAGKQVVNNVSLSLKRGECMGILGVNGAGKTTTFKMLTREEVKDNGDIKINAHSVENVEYLKRLGYCPQTDALNYSLTGREILTTMAMLRGIEDDKIVDQFLDLFGLQKIANIKCEHYSGGNKRRLSFAVAVIGFPDFILLDEPTNGVDPLSRRKFWTLIKKIRDMKQNSFILTSHSMAECEAVCNDLKIMKAGTIRKEGPIAQLKNEVCGFNVMLKLKQDKTEVEGYDDVDGCPAITQITTIEELKNHLQEKFPTGKIRDEHSGMIHYYIESKEKRWSQLFSLFEELKQKSNMIEDYAISEASLEDVFLNVARNDDDNEDLVRNMSLIPTGHKNLRKNTSSPSDCFV